MENRKILNVLVISTLAMLVMCARTFAGEDDNRLMGDNIDTPDLGAEVPDIGVKADMVTKVEVVVFLVGYDDQYYRIHYEDGSVDYHKVSAFRIVEPTEYAGRLLSIRHEVSPQQDSHWRQEGVVMRLRLLKSDLEFFVEEPASLAVQVGSLGIKFVEVLEVIE